MSENVETSEDDGVCQHCNGTDCPKCCAHCLNVANRALLERGEPLLGLATTKELVNELTARVNMAEVMEETWPSYRTVDGNIKADVEFVDEVNPEESSEPNKVVVLPGELPPMRFVGKTEVAEVEEALNNSKEQ